METSGSTTGGWRTSREVRSGGEVPEERTGWTPRRVAVGCLAAVLALPGAGVRAQEPADLQAAFNRFQQHDIAGAEEAFGRVAEADGIPSSEKVTARVLRGLIAWRYRGDFESAERELAIALGLAEDSSGVLADVSRMERERGRLEDAMEAARGALRTAKTPPERAAAARRLGEAALAAADVEVGSDSPRAPDPRARRWLAEARDRLAALLPENRGALSFSRTALRVALLAGDGAGALEAWRSYYVTVLEREDPGLLAEPRRVLERSLPAWAGDGPPPPEGVRAALARALAGSAFFEEAAWAARGLGAGGPVAAPDDPRVEEILAYARFVRDVEELSDAYYRRTAVGEGDPEAFRESLVGRAAALWPELVWEGPAPEFDPETMERELGRRFRAVIVLGTTAGYFDLHYGHRVVDDSLAVEQYGHRADLRFVSVDGMVSNGFQSWAWDYRAQHGGTANEEAIFQVRPASSDSRGAWRAVADSAARAERLERERRETERDWTRAREDPYAYLPGLETRLERQGREALKEELETRGLRGRPLEDAFLAAHREAKFASAIVAHEGRHAIDRRLGLDLPLEDREYRAKLSEVAFAPRPRLALGAILDRNIGDATPHGRANLRIVKGLVAWMEAHAGEIPGLDLERPLLPQLDRLGDAQLRAAFRSMDPLAG